MSKKTKAYTVVWLCYKHIKISVCASKNYDFTMLSIIVNTYLKINSKLHPYIKPKQQIYCIYFLFKVDNEIIQYNNTKHTMKYLFTIK